MKNHRFFLLTCTLSAGVFLLFNSCSKSDDSEKIVPQLTVTPISLTFESEEGSQTIQITSTEIWNLTVSGNWCTASATSGAGSSGKTVTISVGESIEDTDRQATVTITSGSLTQTVLIVQQKRVPNIFIPSDKTGMESDAPALAVKMKLGWNLGNSLEACASATSASETMWGNPTTTQQLIDAVKAAGFNTIRIPCVWSGYIENQATYKIKESWLARVKEVVDYCVATNMYAIINIHWDGGWLQEDPRYATQAVVLKKEKMIWEQIALYFRNYDEHLLFAGTNEVHNKDYSDPTTEHLTVQASFNQSFVDAVRSTGGRNTWRNLIIQAFDTRIDLATTQLKLAADPTDGRQMVEVHYYDPYEYALMESDQSWGTIKYFWGKEGGFDRYGEVSTWGQEGHLRSQFEKMKQTFVDKGIPVILGEYGAIYRTMGDAGQQNQFVESRNYYLGYVTKTALANGLIPVYWDNGVTGDKGLGLFNRTTGAQVHADAIQAIVGAK